MGDAVTSDEQKEVTCHSPLVTDSLVGARGLEPRDSCAQGKLAEDMLWILPAFSSTLVRPLEGVLRAAERLL
jgi:hypothetical protein